MMHRISFATGAITAILAAVVASAGFVARAATQTPPPHPTPTAEPAAPAPEAAPAPRGGDRRGQGPGQRGQGRGQGKLELPEFTPVPAPSPAGLQGKQYFWFTMYPDFVAQYDPATDAVVRKVKLHRGLFWDSILTQDRKHLLVVTDQQRVVEVVDLVTGEVTAEHAFAEEGFLLRVRSVRELPGCRHWLVRTDRVKKEIDRYSFEPSEWLVYDTVEKKVLRKLAKLPEVLERSATLSADGSQLLAQDRDGNLLFLDGRKFEEVARIDLTTPRFFGAGALRLSGTDLLDGRDPKRARMLFTSTDPVESERTSWGIVELDLQAKRIVDVAEWGPQMQTWGLRVAHKKLVGAAMTGNFGGSRGGDNRSHLMLIDLTTGKKIAETYEEFRPRRGLVAISPDADKVYIGVAGNDFEVFDARLQRLKTVELDGEIVGRIHVVDG